MSVHYYVNKDGDRKLGKPELKEVFAKAGYTPEKAKVAPKKEDK
jgi:hypothetical protein